MLIHRQGAFPHRHPATCLPYKVFPGQSLLRSTGELLRWKPDAWKLFKSLKEGQEGTRWQSERLNTAQLWGSSAERKMASLLGPQG